MVWKLLIGAGLMALCVIIHATGVTIAVRWLRDRVASLRHANIYEPQRYRHIVSSILIEGIDRHTVRSVANFLVVRVMQDGQTLLFASGRYLDRIALAPEPLYAERVVVCDSRRFDTLLAIPL